MSDSPDLLRTPRVRCNYCSKRIPANAVLCPNCHRNPRAFYWKRGHVVLLLVLLALVLGALAYFSAPDLRKFVPAGIVSLPTAATSPTRPPITVILVATARPSAVPTRVPPTLRPPNTATRPRPTNTPTATITPTQSPRTTRVTDTPSPVPTPVPVPAPRLVSPTDGERVIGSNKHVVLQFQPAQPLRAQEFFRIQVDYLDRAGNPSSWCGFTRNSQLEFPQEFFDDSSPNIRSFLWRVNVVHSNQVTPVTCDAPYDTLSAASDIWTFYWY